MNEYAVWPDDTLCPIEEVAEMMAGPCAKSDDYIVFESVLPLDQLDDSPGLYAVMASRTGGAA